MASMNLDPNNIVDQIRLLTGDYIEDEPFLSDAIYLWFYQTKGNSVIDAAIEALESIINNLALSPEEWRIGDSSEVNRSITALESRLKDLRVRKKGTRVPIVFGSDRKNWNDFNELFSENYKSY